MKSIMGTFFLLFLFVTNSAYAQEYQILDNPRFISYSEEDTTSVGTAYLEYRARLQTSAGRPGNAVLMPLVKGPLTIRGDHEVLFCSSMFSFDSKREELISIDGSHVVGSHIQCSEPGCLFPPCDFISFLQFGDSVSSPFYELIEE